MVTAMALPTSQLRVELEPAVIPAGEALKALITGGVAAGVVSSGGGVPPLPPVSPVASVVIFTVPWVSRDQFPELSCTEKSII
jgi:hypothetical protein